MSDSEKVTPVHPSSIGSHPVFFVLLQISQCTFQGVWNYAPELSLCTYKRYKRYAFLINSWHWASYECICHAPCSSCILSTGLLYWTQVNYGQMWILGGSIPMIVDYEVPKYLCCFEVFQSTLVHYGHSGYNLIIVDIHFCHRLDEDMMFRHSDHCIIHKWATHRIDCYQKIIYVGNNVKSQMHR